MSFRSFWTLTGAPDLLAHPNLTKVADRLSCTPAQALYRIAQTRGVTPISGTKSEQHMQQDVAVEGLALDEESLTLIDSVVAGVMGLE